MLEAIEIIFLTLGMSCFLIAIIIAMISALLFLKHKFLNFHSNLK
jgi:hypothetical protein